MAVTRINNNQISDAINGNAYVGINAAVKLQNYSVTATKIANNLTYGSDLTITGNLLVQGNTTTIDTTYTTIEDPILLLASNQTGSPTVDIGFVGQRGTSQNIAFVWDESAGEFVTVYTTSGETNTTVSIASYADIHSGNANIGSNLVVNGTSSFVGNLIGNVNVTANVAAGNILTNGLISATGNISGGNINTGGQVNATANITGGNLLTGGLISATGNITSSANVTGSNVIATANITGGNVISSALVQGVTLSASGNVTGGNINSAANISAAGNITASYYFGNGSQLTGVAASTSGFPINAGTSNINAISGGNIFVSIGGTPNVAVFATTGEYISGLLSVTGNIIGGNINIPVGNVDVTNFINAGAVLATGRIEAGTTMSATGNITAANVNTGGLITATGNITSSANVSGGNVIATSNVVGAGASISGNITGGNLITGGIVSATANITGGNLITGGQVSSTGNITSSANVSGGNVIATTIVTAPTITGTIVSASGNITGGNLITGGLISATGNITSAANVSGGNLVATTAVVTPTVTGTTVTVSSTGGLITLAPSSNVSVSSKYINNLSDPVQDQDAATKIYVDNKVTTSIAYHEAVVAATVSTLETATGGTITYAQPNGAGNGVGATLTVAGGTFNLIDTANVQTANTRILVKDQANAVLNGIYVWSNATVITRSADADTYGAADPDALSINDYFFVSSGNVNKGSAYIVDSPSGVITFGTSNIQFAQFSQSQVYTANTQAGILIVGTVISAKVDNNTTAFDGGGNIIVKAGANLTTPNIGAATGTSLSVTGNLTGAGANISGNVTGGNLLTGGLITATGNITSTANVTGGNLLTGGQVSASGNITSAANISGGNVIATTAVSAASLLGSVVSASGNVTGGNLITGGLITATGGITSSANIAGGNLIATSNVVTAGVSASGNVTGGNLLTGGLISSTGNITSSANISGGNVIATTTVSAASLLGSVVSASGNITGGNLVTGGVVSSTGNITSAANVSGGNLLSSGQISSTGNITSAANIAGGNISATGNITASYYFGNGSQLTGVAASTSGFPVTSGTSNIAAVTNGNISITVAGTPNVAVFAADGAYVTGLVSATGNITSSANVGAANVVATNVSATGNITGANINTGGTNGLTLNGANINANAGRITVNSSDLDVDFAIDGDTTANVFYVDAGTGTASFGSSTQTTNAVVAFNASNSILLPVGNTAQRPGTGVTGMLRFNSTLDAVEIYDADSWTTVGTPSFTVISDDQFTGNGVQTVYTLANAYTTNSVIVSINGVVQIPTSAYSVSGTALTFTEAPQQGDFIDVRGLTTTTQVTSISNSPGNAVVSTNPTTNIVNITGNLLPVSNNVQSLGSQTLRWQDLYLAGNSIYIGNIVMKNTSGNTVAFYGPDGTTPATIDSTNVDTTTITNGTSNVSVASSGGNVRFNIGGTSNVMVVNATGTTITGDLSVTGNATLSGNILGDRVQNGTTSFDIQTQNGNANITVSGTSNVAVFATTGAFVTGLISATGNISGGNLNITGNIVDTGALSIITSSNGNITLAPNGTGVVVINTDLRNGQGNGVGNIGSATGYFNTAFVKATSAQYADLAENYTADAEYEPGTVLSFGGVQEVTVSATAGDARIAGIVSTNPSYIMNSTLDSKHVATVALTGRVPTKVSGPVAKGDMMISAGNGRAVACATPTIGTVIGKALENHSGGDGVIEMVVGRL